MNSVPPPPISWLALYNSRNTPHSSSIRARYGVSFVSANLLYHCNCYVACVSVMPFYHVPLIGSLWNLHQTLILWNTCSTCDFRSKGQGHRGHSKFLSAPWLHAYLTDLCYAWHKYSPWCDDVSQFIFRSKDQRSRSHRSFEMKVTPASSFIWPSLPMWHTYNTWGGDVSWNTFCDLSDMWLHAYLTGLLQREGCQSY